MEKTSTQENISFHDLITYVTGTLVGQLCACRSICACIVNIIVTVSVCVCVCVVAKQNIIVEIFSFSLTSVDMQITNNWLVQC